MMHDAITSDWDGCQHLTNILNKFIKICKPTFHIRIQPKKCGNASWIKIEPFLGLLWHSTQNIEHFWMVLAQKLLSHCACVCEGQVLCNNSFNIRTYVCICEGHFKLIGEIRYISAGANKIHVKYDISPFHWLVFVIRYCKVKTLGACSFSFF